MSINKAHRARRDTSEREIIDVLEARGFMVRKMAQRGLPDLVVWWIAASGAPSPPHFIECKTKKAKLRETQHWDTVGLKVDVLRTAEEAMQWNRK